MTPKAAMEKAVTLSGGQSALAASLGVRPPTVHQWLNGERPIPPRRAIEIERAVKGLVCRKDLCPGFPWEPASFPISPVIATAD